MFNLFIMPPSVSVGVDVVFFSNSFICFFSIVCVSLFIEAMGFTKFSNAFIIAVLKSLSVNYNVSVIYGYFSID